MITGWQLIRKFLEETGTEHVFGLPGTQNADLFGELSAASTEIVSCSHELNSGFAAVGYAIARRRPAVLLTISGPGFCYAVPPLVEALHDSVPLVHVVIGAATRKDRNFELQDIDHVGISERVAKAARHVSRSTDLYPTLSWAWNVSNTGEPGPVVVLIDGNVLDVYQDDVGGRHVESGDDHKLMLPAGLDDDLRDSRVLVYAGRGASGSSALLLSIAERMQWPVITTVSGRGIISESHCLSLCCDQCDVNVVNDIIGQFDKVLAIGVKFTHTGSVGFRLEIPPEKLVHVDASNDVLSENYPADVVIQASAETFLQALDRALGDTKINSVDSQCSDARQRLLESKPDKSFDPVFLTGEPEDAESYFSRLQAGFPSDTYYVTDSGLHQLLFRRHFVAEFPDQLILPTDFQSMGFGLPAAIGVSIAKPDTNVVVIHGDGGFRMVAMELALAAELNLRIRILLLDDGSYGLIRQQQLGSGNLDYGCRLPQIDYRQLAESLGVAYVDATDGMHGVLETCDQCTGPVLIRQPIMDSPMQAKVYAKMRIRGKIRRSLDPRLLEWMRGVKGQLKQK